MHFFVQTRNFSNDDRVRAIVKKRALNVPLHIHQFAEFLYVMEGEIIVKHDSIDEIARAGDIVLIPPFQEHGYQTPKNVKPKHYMILFSDTLISDIVNSESFCFEIQKMVFTPSNEFKKFLELRMFKTGDEIIEPDYKDKILLKSLIYGVFAEYFKKHSDVSALTSINERKIASNIIESVVKYMRMNFRHDVSIEDCAKETGYSISHISHALPNHLHITFLQLRNSLRINYARKLLLHSKMSTKMIGYECGFNSEKTFERVFKQLIGMTPQQFRNGTQKKNNKEEPLQK